LKARSVVKMLDTRPNDIFDIPIFFLVEVFGPAGRRHVSAARN